MNIGILGTRGIPNLYGGFEQFAQFLAVGLVQRGHQVTVYNSSHHKYQEADFQGVAIVHCTDWEDRIGTAGQFIYDLNCFIDARKRGFDVLLQLGYTSSSVYHPIWPLSTKNIVNMDGLEWKRSKYNGVTKRFLKFAEKLAVKHADLLVSDSIGIQEYLRREYNAPSTYIPYGANVFDDPDTALLPLLNVKPHEYFLIIARMEPENNIEMIIMGYLMTGRTEPLLIVGNFKNKFGQYLSTTYNNDRIIFAGPIFDETIINNLRFFSKIYFHGHSVGGTNPSLLEAMACSSNIAAHDNEFNRNILTTDASYFASADEVSAILKEDAADSVVATRKTNNISKIKTLYSWPRIIEDYETVFERSLNN